MSAWGSAGAEAKLRSFVTFAIGAFVLLCALTSELGRFAFSPTLSLCVFSLFATQDAPCVTCVDRPASPPLLRCASRMTGLWLSLHRQARGGRTGIRGRRRRRRKL